MCTYEMKHNVDEDGSNLKVKTALAGFLDDLSTANMNLKSQLKLQEKRLNMMERKSSMNYRPNLSIEAELDIPHKKAFSAYLRSGDDDAIRGLELEEKALSGDGGYLVDPQTARQIASVLYSVASIRSIANVVSVESSSYDILVDQSDIGSGWATLNNETSNTRSPKIERVSIPLHELSALPKVSQRLLDDSAFDVECWLASRIADKFSRAEGKAFIIGDGSDKPKGFLSYSCVKNANWKWGKLGYVATGVDGDFNTSSPADAIVDLVYSLGARYRANASFVMNSKTAGAVRKMKDADGRFLWSDGLSSGEPARLMGYQVLIAEDMPDIALNSTAIAFGDFMSGYTIAERPDLRILRDPFSAKPHVLFYATKRVGGDVSDFAAIKVLQFSKI